MQCALRAAWLAVRGGLLLAVDFIGRALLTGAI